jgi:hypothetical protein
MENPRGACPLLLGALLAFLTGCGGASTKVNTPPTDGPAGEVHGLPRSSTALKDGSTPEASGAPGLPGPPGAAAAPQRSPTAGEVEDRLYQSDAGRVVLKAMRAHGGYERFRSVSRLTAATRPAPRAGTGESKQAAGRRFEWTDPAGSLPAESERERRIATAPFWFSNPVLRLEYLGVEIDAPTGEVFDKLRVFETRPGSSWLVAYFSRRTSLLSRLVLIRAQDGKPPASPRSERVDLSDFRAWSGLWLAARWTEFNLPDRFARADLEHPDLEEELEFTVSLDGEMRR